MKPDFNITTDQFKTTLEVLLFHYMKDYQINEKLIGKIVSIEVDQDILKVSFKLEEVKV